jgi:hypothetical protein
MKRHNEAHLKIYRNRSVLVFEDGTEIVFYEGPPSEAAKQRLDQIRRQLQTGWLDNLFANLPQSADTIEIEEHVRILIQQIVESITSEIGRAVTGLAILQLAVKSIAPEQCIRLHKGGRGSFSWREGLPMRSLDSQFITPFLRKHDLLRINKYGVFMTRSLAENYPYSPFYKASIRGARDAWLTLIDKVEAAEVNAENALRYLLALLRNRAEWFTQLSDRAIEATNQFLATGSTFDSIFELILKHIDSSFYSARLLEVCMHAFLQVLEDRGLLNGRLLPLCQMRTANKKHRNVADIEIVSIDDEIIIEAWDAKYGKPYLLDELNELLDKLQMRSLEIAGFVVEREPDLRPEILNRMNEISELTETEIKIVSLYDWIEFYLSRLQQHELRDDIAREWMIAYIESLCQRRRDRAPIDEPADLWVKDWVEILRSESEEKNPHLSSW